MSEKREKEKSTKVVFFKFILLKTEFQPFFFNHLFVRLGLTYNFNLKHNFIHKLLTTFNNKTKKRIKILMPIKSCIGLVIIIGLLLGKNAE